jgi:2,4-dienoyl-CoA reductase-like NADH-dependent reductase (Old Yellow Enzyme family)
MADANGLVTDQLLALYRPLTSSGIGLIITGHLYVRRDGQASWGMTAADRDECLPGLARLARTVHESGPSLLAAQINHGGRQVPGPLANGDMVAPSALPLKAFNNQPRALRTDELDALAAAYAAAARRVQEAGFDGVQLHAAHGYLISQFLSPLANQRTDEYGGTLENRARFLELVVRKVRQAVGRSFCVLIKLGVYDEGPGGLTLDESVRLAAWLETWGIAAIEVSGGINAHSTKRNISTPEDEAFFADQAAAIKKAVRIPVISVGGYRSLAVMERVLATGQADAVSLSRPFVNEPDLATRFKGGRSSRAACVSCNRCFLVLGRKEPLRCAFKDNHEPSPPGA